MTKSEKAQPVPALTSVLLLPTVTIALAGRAVNAVSSDSVTDAVGSSLLQAALSLGLLMLVAEAITFVRRR